MTINEWWESTQDHKNYVKWRVEEDPSKALAGVVDMLTEPPKFIYAGEEEASTAEEAAN